MINNVLEFDDGPRRRMKPAGRGYLIAATVAAATLAACGGGSSKGATSSTLSSSGPTVSAPASSPSTTAATNSTSSAKALPDPCTLLTKQEVSPLFGTTALTQKSATDRPGTCAFNLTTGVQAKEVLITTKNDYASDLSFAFPQGSQGKPVALGDQAVLEAPQTSLRRITVKLGKNALRIDVDFYTSPPDESFVTQLAKDALGRVQ